MKEMIELQQQGLARGQESGGSVGGCTHGNDPSDPEEGEAREEEGWESGDECKWSSEDGEIGEEVDEEEKETV